MIKEKMNLNVLLK